MRKIQAIAVLTTFLTAAGPAQSEVRLADLVQVLGRVTAAAGPVENALVIAFNLATHNITQTFTDRNGSFKLPTLPGGVYRVIAVKRGFAPAVATVTPSAFTQKVVLRLPDTVATQSEADTIWEIRSSLPSDVLRELGDVLTIDSSRAHTRALSAEMSSLTAVSAGETAETVSRTAVGVRGELGRGWSVGLRGKMNRIDDGFEPLDNSILSESTGVVMEVRSPARTAYKLASTSNVWKVQGSDPARRQADLRAHHFEWDRGASSVRVHYLAHENLFPSQRLTSELFELAGGTTLLRTPRSELAVSMRLRQQNVPGSHEIGQRLADVSATGGFDLRAPVTIRYGVRSRTTTNGSDWSPTTGAEIHLTPKTTFLVSGVYKVTHEGAEVTTLPEIVLWSQEESVAPRYAWSVGLISGNEATGRFSTIATVSAVDSLSRVVFDDYLQQFGDGFYLEAGDLRRDVKFGYQKQIGTLFAIDLETVAGFITNSLASSNSGEKSYLVGTLQSTFHPSGTSVDVSYRQLEGGDSALFVKKDAAVWAPVLPTVRSERINLQMSQSLHLQVNVRLLLALELERSPADLVLTGPGSSDTLRTRYLGGLSVAF